MKIWFVLMVSLTLASCSVSYEAVSTASLSDVHISELSEVAEGMFVLKARIDHEYSTEYLEALLYCRASMLHKEKGYNFIRKAYGEFHCVTDGKSPSSGVILVKMNRIPTSPTISWDIENDELEKECEKMKVARTTGGCDYYPPPSLPPPAAIELPPVR